MDGKWWVHYKAMGADHKVGPYDTQDEGLSHARDIAGYEGVTGVRAETQDPSGAIRGFNLNQHAEVSLTYAHTAEEFQQLLKVAEGA